MKELIYAFYMLVGTYTDGASDGIYVYGFDPETARTEYVGMARVENPSYMTASADGRRVYAVTENGDGERSTVNAFAFDASTGALTLLDSEATSGSAPCNVATNGRVVVTANYGGGDVSVFPVVVSGGTGRDGGAAAEEGIGPLARELYLPDFMQAGRKSHMHCVKFSPDGRWLFATDLGTDNLLRWDMRPDGTPAPESIQRFDVARGSGPRHFVFDASGRNVYLINEVSGTVMAFRYNDGDLEHFQTILADYGGGHGSADIVLGADGRHLYASNRLKGDGVAIFAVSPEDGTLKSAGYRTTGIHPRNLAVAPGGRWLLVSCRDSGAVEVYATDPATGALTPTDRNVAVDKPVCVTFIPAVSVR